MGLPVSSLGFLTVSAQLLEACRGGKERSQAAQGASCSRAWLSGVPASRPSPERGEESRLVPQWPLFLTRPISCSTQTEKGKARPITTSTPTMRTPTTRTRIPRPPRSLWKLLGRPQRLPRSGRAGCWSLEATGRGAGGREETVATVSVGCEEAGGGGEKFCREARGWVTDARTCFVLRGELGRGSLW